MYARKNVGGSPIIPYHEYDIGSLTEVHRGQAVKLSGGLVVPATTTDTSELLGVAAEEHSGTDDALNERSNGGRIYVYDAKETVFACPAPRVTALSGGSATTIKVTALKVFAADDFNGGLVKLVSKGANSANTESVGTVRAITDFAPDSGTPTMGVLTVASGGVPGEGDVYELYPPAGFAKGSFDSSITKLVLSAAASIKVKVTGHELGAGNVLLQRA